MTASELLVKTNENFLDYIDYCLDQYDKNGVCEINIEEWYLKINKAIDAIYRETEGLPPAPIRGRPKGSKDRVKRKVRKP